MSVRAEPAIWSRYDRLFYVGMALWLNVTALVGFGWSFLRADLLAKELQHPFIQAHALTFISWLLLFLTQTVLVVSGRTDVHRRLGVAGAALATVMISLSVISGVTAFQESHLALEFKSFAYFTIPHVNVIFFAVLVTAGLLHRGQPETHKRLMLLATIALLEAVTSRVPLIWYISRHAHFVVEDLFVVAAILYDLVSRGRVHPANIWGALMIVVLRPFAEPAALALKAMLYGS